MNRWVICLTGTAINICLGVLYSWSIFVVPLSKKFGWTRAQLSWPFTISIFTFALVMVAAGKWQDKAGPRIVCVTGGVVMGVGFILTSYISSLSALYLTFGVIGGAGVAMGYVTPIAAIVKWFPDKKGLTVGIGVSGFGFGAFVFTPIAVKLIKSVGVMSSFFYLGIIWIVAVGGLGMILQNPPAGYKPEGWEPPAPVVGVQATEDWDVGDMVKTPTFWLLWLAFLGNASVGIMVISMIAPYAKTLGISAETAAYLIGFLSIANGLGRIIAGFLSDALGRTKAMILIFSITTVNVFLLEAPTELTSPSSPRPRRPSLAPRTSEPTTPPSSRRGAWEASWGRSPRQRCLERRPPAFRAMSSGSRGSGPTRRPSTSGRRLAVWLW
jgi:OFA family oxalate/formate antiporter-like MFS transporter